MRVVYVIPGMCGSGGAERSLAALIPAVVPRVEMHIVTWTGRSDLRGEIEAGGATLTDLSTSGRPSTLVALRDFIETTRPDLVHTTLVDADIVGRVAAATSRVPVVSSLVNDNHGLDVVAHHGATANRALAWAVDAATARLAVRFHALTDHVATVMARRLAIPRHRIDVIPRGRDPVRLGTRTDERRAAARRELGVGPDEPLVIAAARHERQKGLDVLLRAVPAVLARQPRTRFVIAGRNGGASQELAELAGRVAGAVDFVGQRDDVGELMCAADVWCVPSRWEGFGGILIEAMALEVPAVASDIPPIREVTGTPSCVTLVPPDQPLKLADAICRVFDDPAGAQLRTTHGRQRFLAEFTVDRVADRMVEFYERAHSDSRLTASMLDRGFG